MPIEFNPNRLNGTAGGLNKARVEKTADKQSPAVSVDKVSVSSVSSTVPAEVQSVVDSEQAKALAQRIREQIQQQPEFAQAAYGKANSDAMQNLLDAV